MDDLLVRYPAIKKLFGEKWLNDPKNKANHPLFQICDETEYLSALNRYLAYMGCARKTTADQLKNAEQFFDIYYELEICYFLRKLGLKPELHKIICGIETEEQKLVVEVKHLRIPDKVDSGSARLDPKSKCHIVPKPVDLTFLNMERMKDYLYAKKFQDAYPNIVCFCPDISAGKCYDLDNLVSSCNVPKEVSVLALWRFKKILCLYENPYGKKLEWESSELKKFFNIT